MRFDDEIPTPAEFEELLALAWSGNVRTDTGLDDRTIDALAVLAAAPAAGKPQAEQDARAAYARAATPN